MNLHVVGIDLGKTVFHLVGLDASGQMVVRKRCSLTQLLAFTAKLEVQLIGCQMGRTCSAVARAQILKGAVGSNTSPTVLLRSTRPSRGLRCS